MPTLGLVLALVLVGCGGGGKSAAPAKSSSPTPKIFATPDLGRMVFLAADGPTDLQAVAEMSGDKTPDQFAEEFGDKDHPEDMTKLRGFGLLGARVSMYGSAGVVDKLSANQDLGPGMLVVVSFALLFTDEGGASSDLAYEKTTSVRDNPGMKEVSAPSLGEGAWGFSGTFAKGPEKGFVYAWRTGNVLCLTALTGGTGAIDEAGARAIVTKIAAHAV